MAHPQAAAPPTYIHAIPGLREGHGNLPAVLGNLDLNRSINAGDAIDSRNLEQAKSVATGLRAIHTVAMDERITAEVVENAELRATAIEAAHSFVKYTPVDMAQALVNLTNQLGVGLAQMNQNFNAINQRFNAMDQRFNFIDQRLDAIDQRLDQTVALSENNRILGRNARLQAPHPLAPLQKTVLGHGLALAQAISTRLSAAVRQQLVAPVPIANVGTVPLNFNPTLPNYTHLYILNLAIFYNNDFGIIDNDTLPQRVEKFRRFLTEF